VARKALLTELELEFQQFNGQMAVPADTFSGRDRRRRSRPGPGGADGAADRPSRGHGEPVRAVSGHRPGRRGDGRCRPVLPGPAGGRESRVHRPFVRDRLAAVAQVLLGGPGGLGPGDADRGP
jgi:hypothetical protein